MIHTGQGGLVGEAHEGDISTSGSYSLTTFTTLHDFISLLPHYVLRGYSLV